MQTLLAAILSFVIGIYMVHEMTGQVQPPPAEIHVHCEDGSYRLDGKAGDAVRVIDEQGNWLTCGR